jgi:hypothetical protein
MSCSRDRPSTDLFGFLFLACIVLCGCRSIPPPPPRGPTANLPAPVSSTNSPATVTTHYPSQPHRFSTWQKLNPAWWFGNADDPVAPDWYRPGKSCRNFMWHLRNPCHNFNCYVIGITDKPFTRIGRFPDRVENPNDGWNWTVCRYKRLRLPFVDYKHRRFEFYCGWRSSGAFGMKLNFAKRMEAPPKEPAPRTEVNGSAGHGFASNGKAAEDWPHCSKTWRSQDGLGDRESVLELGQSSAAFSRLTR